MSAAYFWRNNKVVVVVPQTNNVTAQECAYAGCEGYLCIDSSCDDPKMRYGRFSSEFSGWEPVYLGLFPKEFRAHLLLLGVT